MVDEDPTLGIPSPANGLGTLPVRYEFLVASKTGRVLRN